MLAGNVVAKLLSTALFVAWFVSPLVSLLIIFALLLGGPAAILLIGVKKRRLGMILGPLLLIPIFAIWRFASDWAEMRDEAQRLAELDMRSFATPASQHHMIAMEYSRSKECDLLCQLILVNSDYAVAVSGISSDWTVYRRISHAGLCGK